MHRCLFAFFLLNFSLCAHSQIRIQNGSFEGTPGGFGTPLPGGWLNCVIADDIASATMPWGGWIPHVLPAHSDSTYLGTGYNPEYYSIGKVSQEICAMVARKVHTFSVYLYTFTEGDVMRGFGNGVLRVYGGSTSCDTQQLLWQSPPTTNAWSLYYADFIPDSAWTHITLMPGSLNGTRINLGVDAMSDIAVHDNYTFLAIDTVQNEGNSCYTLTARSDMNGVNYSWHSVPALQFDADSMQQVCISEDTWVYVDLLGGCGVYSDSVLLKHEGALTSIDVLNAKRVLNVYPNPAKQQVTVKYNIPNVDKLCLVDVIGNVIEEKPANMFGNEVFDVKDIQDGLYFLKMIDTTGKLVASEKIVISK